MADETMIDTANSVVARTSVVISRCKYPYVNRAVLTYGDIV